MASAVIGLDTGPTDMMASTLLSRIAAATLFGSYWMTLILSGAFGLAKSSDIRITILSGETLYCRKITLSNSMLFGDRPTTPRRRPTRSGIFSTGSFLDASLGAALALALPFAAALGGSGALGTMKATTFLRRI